MTDERRIRLVFRVVALLLGGTQAWIARHQLSSDDAIAYLDIGDAYLRGDWHTAINAYWSPLYSWILGATTAIVRPSMEWEFALVKFVNLAIFAATIACFELFLGRVLVWRKRDEASGGLSPTTLTALGYGVFLWTSLAFIGVSSDTPDMLVAAFTFVAAALVLRIHDEARRVDFLLLGLGLAAAYLAKAAMFPVAFVFIAVAVWSTRDRSVARRGAFFSALGFVAVAGPFVTAISLEKGRPTFGDAGRLNYAWIVTRDVVPYRFWLGRDGRGGTPHHPPRVLVPRPQVFEFAQPVGGTYPPWHDPSYWYEGLSATVKWDRQFAALTRNAVEYLRSFGAAFIVAWIALVGFGDTARRSARAAARAWTIWIPVVAVLSIYLIATDLAAVNIPTQPSLRFIGSAVTLLAMVGLASLRTPTTRRLNVISAMLLGGIVFALSMDLARRFNLTRTTDATLAAAQPAIATAIRAMGIQPGDRVAISGPYIFPYFHWARLARVKVVAEIYHPDFFWEQGADVRAEIEARLRTTGARAIIQRVGITQPKDESGWSSAGSGYWIKVLP